MKKKHRLIFLFFLVISIPSFRAQDLIIKRDGGKIYCRIVKVDSASIYYIRPSQKNTSEISNTEVQSYHTKAPEKNKQTPADTTKSKQELLVFQISGGFANPTGDFGDKDMDNERSGLANTGFLVHGTLILKLTPYFGFCADYGYQRHSVAASIIERAYATSLPSNVAVSVETTHWSSQGFFGGVYLSAPLKTVKNLSIDFSVMGGLPKFKSPELSIDISQPGLAFSVLQSEGETKAAAFLGKMELRHRIDGVAFSLGVGYFMAKPTFSNVLIKDSSGASGYAKFEQKITSLNVVFGISFSLL